MPVCVARAPGVHHVHAAGSSSRSLLVFVLLVLPSLCLVFLFCRMDTRVPTNNTLSQEGHPILVLQDLSSKVFIMAISIIIIIPFPLLALYRAKVLEITHDADLFGSLN